MFKGLFQTKKTTPKAEIAWDLTDIDLNNIPKHIAIIMDGNGRWAKAQGKVRTFGHQAGAETLKTIVRAADKLGVKVISAYAFSTENWKRPVTEVNFIMELLSRYLTSEIEEFNENNVQVRFLGSREGLPEIVKQKMDNAIDATITRVIQRPTMLVGHNITLTIAHIHGIDRSHVCYGREYVASRAITLVH